MFHWLLAGRRRRKGSMSTGKARGGNPHAEKAMRQMTERTLKKFGALLATAVGCRRVYAGNIDRRSGTVSAFTPSETDGTCDLTVRATVTGRRVRTGYSVTFRVAACRKNETQTFQASSVAKTKELQTKEAIAKPLRKWTGQSPSLPQCRSRATFAQIWEDRASSRLGLATTSRRNENAA